uniref:MYND-type domain-containing protein n=1 Tax=Leersia perrieri TaxID=77586 RepID=A0A0D9XS49_9ORYZ
MRSPKRRRIHTATTTLSCSAMSPAAGEPDPLSPAAKRDADDVFDRLPDDIVLTILANLAAAASSPADILSASLACRRLHALASHPSVLSRASPAAAAVRRAASWLSDDGHGAHNFLRRCAVAGSAHACYFLGMVWLYCLGRIDAGAAMLARAAWRGGHAPAMYALAVVRFNGGGGGEKGNERDARGGVALCARAAWMGYAPAMRELGHCLVDGYGAPRHTAAGRSLLLHAAAIEHLDRKYGRHGDGEDEASRFMVDWWETRRRGKKAAKGGCVPGDGGEDDGEVRMCSQERCGRRERRRHEFRRCAACGAASYCSRACQAIDWKRAHRAACAPARWLAGDGGAH